MKRVWRSIAWLGAMAVAVSCGDDGGDSSGASTASATGTTAGGTMGTDSTAGTSATTMGTGASDGTMGTGPGTSAGSSGGAQDGVSYSAVSIPGDPNQIQIRRKDDESDRCSWIILTDQSVGLLAIATPDGWTPQVGLSNGNPDSCDAGDPLVGGSQEASSGTGDITAVEPGMGAVPCSVDIDVELDFPQLDVVEVFAASSVPVEGC